MTLTFVNINGDAVDTTGKPKEKRVKPVLEVGYHKGWRFKGVKPGAMDEAKLLAEKVRLPFNEQNWFMNAPRTAVRSKPYEIRDAADICKTLAEKAGWTGVFVEEVKKEVQS